MTMTSNNKRFVSISHFLLMMVVLLPFFNNDVSSFTVKPSTLPTLMRRMAATSLPVYNSNNDHDDENTRKQKQGQQQRQHVADIQQLSGTVKDKIDRNRYRILIYS